MTAGRTEPMPIAQVGTLIGGKLRVLRTIGKGAMGVIYEAHDAALGRRVAVKVMAPEISQDERQRRRFAREAGAASQLKSAHAARVFEVGEDRGAPYIAMEYLEGRTLAAVLEGGPLATATVVDWMLQALDAIAEAHLMGLVHRDIKPANLFLVEQAGREPFIKVLDFGLVKDLDPSKMRLTKTGAPLGTPSYMAPEQVRAVPDIDFRADVWSFGVTLYELLTSRLPFVGSSLPVLLTRILQEEPAPVRAHRADIPPALESVVARCLMKERTGRYASAVELRVALEAATIGLARTLRLEPRRDAPPGPSAGQPPYPIAPPGSHPGSHRSHAVPASRARRAAPASRVPIFLGALLAVLVLGGLALALVLLTHAR